MRLAAALAALALAGRSSAVPALPDGDIRNAGLALETAFAALAREAAPPSNPSSLQPALDACMVLTQVRRLKSGTDFANIYGSCLTRAKELEIDSVVPGSGLTVYLLTHAPPEKAAAYDGWVVVNAGAGPVRVVLRVAR